MPERYSARAWPWSPLPRACGMSASRPRIIPTPKKVSVNNSVFATFLAYAPKQLSSPLQRKELVAQLREKIMTAQAETKISITDINGLLVIRYLGSHAQQCKQLFITLWQVLRPLLLDKTAIQPRIWHT